MSDYILVPMQLDIMVINEQISVTTSFLRFQMNYKNLQNYNTPEPAPFEGADLSPPTPGIYLSWTLPKALSSSIPVAAEAENTDAEAGFPFVPNRYLVARVQSGVSPETALTAWILDSDYLDDNNATSPYVNPFLMNSNGTPRATKIGRAIPFTPTTTIEPPANEAFLKAIGPGNSTFAVYSPGVDNVFAFYDDLAGIDQANFSYYVIGWYANSSDDPLKNTNWALTEEGNFLNSLFDWIVYADNPADIPQAMLVHSLVSDVPWDRHTSDSVPDTYPENVPENVKVSFGDSSTEALEAIVGLDINATADAKLLSAFNNGALNLYEDATSPAQLEIEKRQHWYGASSGGTYWCILSQEPNQSTALPAPTPTPISPQQQAALNKLNNSQKECDRQQRILQSMQYTLYNLWWKYKWQTRNTPPVEMDFQIWLSTQLNYQVEGNANSTGWYIDQVRAQQVTVADLVSQVDTARQAVEILLDAETQRLQATSLPQYYYANDPVLAVTGLKRATNYDPTGSVLCRLIRQTVKSLTVNGVQYGITEDAEQNISSQIPVLYDPQHVLPEGIEQLNIENFFLSPALFAQNILGGADEADAVSAAILALPPPEANNSFPPEAYAYKEWQQPWVPLLLDWQLTLFKEPAYQTQQMQPTAIFNRDYWLFDGTNYVWNGPTTAEGTNFNEVDSMQMQLSGRTFIGPYVSTTTAAQVATLVKGLAQWGESFEQAAVSKNLADIQEQDILSQRVSGLMNLMVQRNNVANVAPSEDIVTAIGEGYQGYSNPYPHELYAETPAVWDFSPMRGTFFLVNKLTAIDIFGRTVNLMHANYSKDPSYNIRDAQYYFYPIASEDLQAPTTISPQPEQSKTTSPTQNMLQLTPRFIQDAQLAFNLTANNETNEDILYSNNTPICGWFVSNHLNNSLAVYAPDGQSWGQLYLAAQASADIKIFIPSWQPDPVNPDAPQTVADIPNIYIRAILTDLMQRTDNGSSFNDFIQAIDQTLWTVDPDGKHNDPSMTVLMGRALAVVRANLALKLRGYAYTNQDWWNTFDVDMNNLPPADQPAPLANVTGGVFDYQWSVRLGSQELNSDGLVGYYLDDPNNPEQTFHYFNCVHTPDTVGSNYLKKIGTGNYINLRFTDDHTINPDPTKNEIAYVTMIMDPSTSCHAFTGLLPVYTKLIPEKFVKPALNTLCYLFTAGPIITPPEQASMPIPAEDQGTWAWFDKASQQTIPLSPTSNDVRFMTPPPLAKQGWLKFIPDVTDPTSKDDS